MHQGNWQCSGCGGAITELPFEPRGTANLKCRDCFAKGNGGQSKPQGERKMFSGQWECSGCKGAITELPFDPRETGNLLCKNCYHQKKIA